MTDTDLKEVLEYFGQEQACYTALLDLSRRQKGVIETGTVDELLRILGQKQQLLAQVSDIENRLRQYKKNWQEIRTRLDQNDRAVLDLALSTVEELLAELIELEKQSEQLLTRRRDDTKQGLVEAAQGKTVHHAYATSQSTEATRTTLGGGHDHGTL